MQLCFFFSPGKHPGSPNQCTMHTANAQCTLQMHNAHCTTQTANAQYSTQCHTKCSATQSISNYPKYFKLSSNIPPRNGQIFNALNILTSQYTLFRQASSPIKECQIHLCSQHWPHSKSIIESLHGLLQVGITSTETLCCH